MIKLFTYNSAQFTESTPLDVLYEEADSYINGDGRESDVNIAAKNFIDASRMDMEDLRINSMVKDALAINILTTRSDGYIHHNIGWNCEGGIMLKGGILDETQKIFNEFGLNFGMAFKLSDDVLDCLPEAFSISSFCCFTCSFIF